MSAPFKTRPSPFYPDSGSHFDGGLSYKGLFLHQNPQQTATYYSVGAVYSQLINGFTSYFLGWEAISGSASFQHADSPQTALVFNQPNTTVNARFKAHLGSSSSGVTSPSAQRKVIRDASGNFHMAYASAGHIWYARSTDSGATWSQEARLSSDLGSEYVSGTPSLTVQENTHLVVVVWERYVLNASTYHDILACTVTPSTGVPGTETVIGQWTGSPSQGLVSGPVVAAGKASSQYVLALWLDPASAEIMGAVRSDASGSWSADVSLRSVNASYLSLAPISVSGYHDTTWHAVWVENSNLTYGEITIGTSLTLSNITTIATGDWETPTIKNPSIAGYQNGSGGNRAVAVAWQEYITAWNEDVIKEREYVINNSWGTITVWSGSTKNPIPYVTPSLSAHYQSITKAITWGNVKSFV